MVLRPRSAVVTSEVFEVVLVSVEDLEELLLLDGGRGLRGDGLVGHGVEVSLERRLGVTCDEQLYGFRLTSVALLYFQLRLGL